MERTSGARIAGTLFMLGGAALAVHALYGDTPDWRFRAAMSAVIAGIGAALFLLGPDADAKVTNAPPDKPWLARTDWAQGMALSETRTQARVAGLIGAICLLMSVPIAWQLPGEVDKGNHLAWIALAFPAAGIYLTGMSILAFLRDRQYRDARLEMSRVPGVLGGKLGGRIVVGRPLAPGTAVELTLSCVHSYASKQDTDRTRWQRVLWQDESTATATTDGVAGYIPVEFTIPVDARATDGRDVDDEILWRLEARAEAIGPDLQATFVAPVFRTSESDEGLTTARLDLERQRRATAPASADGARLYLPAARHKGSATMLTAFGLLSVGSGTFFGYLLRQWLGWFGFLLPLVPIGGLGLLLLAIAGSLWFRSTTIEIGARELRVRTIWLGLLWPRLRVIQAGSAARIELHSGMQRGDEVWYDLRVHFKGGGKATVGDGMSRKEADWLAAEARRALDVAE